jgi:pimeloyl-ACP methyl ester carboxylesterase
LRSRHHTESFLPIRLFRLGPQGGDWGSAVCAWLGLDHGAGLRGIHLNYLLVQPQGTAQTNEERSWLVARDKAQQQLGAYAALQGTKPLSIAYAMAANPVAQAAWIVERFYDWSDQRERDFAAIFSRDELLTDIMIYVMNDAFASSAFYYAAAAAENVRQMAPGAHITVPTAFTAYPDPRLPPPPRTWVERGYNLTRWQEAEHGGHFAAMEVPDFFVHDLRAWAAAID